MIIYKSTAYEFDIDVRFNKITQKLEDEFIKILGRKPSDAERRSFSNSLSKMNDVLINEDLVKRDCGILIEYQLPSSSMRLDFMITGKDKFLNKNAVIVELKQWDKVDESDTDRQVYTYTGGSIKEVNHPAVQVSRYKNFLEDYHSAFHKENRDGIKLYSCSYLHNYQEKEHDKLLDLKFKPYIDSSPVFIAKDVKAIGHFIRSNVEKGDGIELLDIIEKSIPKPSKKLIEHINNIIDAKSEFILVDDQLIVYDRVMQIVKSRKLDGSDGKYVVLVRGGAGTGKSVIGLNLLSKILNEKSQCVYIAANGAFKNGMANMIDKDRAKALFKHPYYYNKELVLNNETFSVAIVDEAHRISTTPPPMQKKLDNTLVQEIISKTHLSVFFTDDNQMIRPNDIGSYSHIKEVAQQLGSKLYEYELKAQFRCAGSEGYLNWLDDILGIRETANASGWENIDDLEFHIVDDPNVLREKILEYQNMGMNSRIVAGYAWPWSKELKSDGTLISDVVVYDDGFPVFEMPWNPQDTYKGRKAKGIPKGTADWAINPNGVNQIGCIHTSQGLEFDYVGVIIGEEFKYNLKDERWEADVAKCYDSKIGKNSQDDFLRLTQNTYKTLLTRGIKGVYVYSVDKDTQEYLRRRLKTVQTIEDNRFYHKKKIGLNRMFGIDKLDVAEAGCSYIESDKILSLENFNISKMNETYMFCDIVDEKVAYDFLKEYKNSASSLLTEDVVKILENSPQIRYYTEPIENVIVSVRFTEITPIAIVKRVLDGKEVISFIFK